MGSGNDGEIQAKTMQNADNFAWIISYNLYEKAYNWYDDGRWNGINPKKRQVGLYDDEWIGNETTARTALADIHDPAEYRSMWKKFGLPFKMSRQ